MIERLSEGVVVLVIGMVIVFSVLILLWAILLGFKQVFYTIPQKRKAKESAAEVSVKQEKTVAAAPAPVPQTAVTDDSEIVAVIAAAISSMTGMDTSKFKIKSIKRISNWNK